MAPVRSRCSRPQPGARDPTRPDRRHVTGGQPASTGHWPDTRLTAGSQSASRATIPAALSRPAKHRSSRSGSTPAAKATGRLPRITAGRRAFSQTCSTTQRDVVHRPRPADHRPVQHAVGPAQRFGGCGAPRGTAERKAPIWYLDPHCLLCTNRGEDPPCAIAGSWTRGAQRAGPGAEAVAAVHGSERAREGGSCRTWEPSTSSGSWNARPPNRLRLAGLRMITPRWTL